MQESPGKKAPLADTGADVADVFGGQSPWRSPAHAERAVRLLRTAPTSKVRAFAQSAEFGRIPAYLRETMNVLEDEREYIESLPEIEAEVEDPDNRRRVRLLTDIERLSLVEGLMGKREQVARCLEAELLLHHEDLWKRKVRARYEPQIEQIDKDLEKMSRRYIFVASSDGAEADDEH
mmetsp:Transcript_87985/g.152439  ORF Transcript_87985/g.152439 Transcript_87985/m.152439 type:complete len:178 (+) Transcript_87985:154-687(+)